MFLGSHISRQISQPQEQGQASYSKESPFLRRSLRKLAKSGKAWTRLRRDDKTEEGQTGSFVDGPDTLEKKSHTKF